MEEVNSEAAFAIPPLFGDLRRRMYLGFCRDFPVVGYLLQAIRILSVVALNVAGSLPVLVPYI